MDISNIVRDALLALGGAGIFLAVLAWMGKRLFDQHLHRDLERFKAKLRATADAEIEAMKSQVQNSMHQHTVRFEYLHRKRADFIADLYEHLQQAKFDASIWSRFTAINPDDEKILSLYRDSLKNWQELTDLTQKNSLYLPKQLADRIDTVVSHVMTPIIAIEIGQPHPKEIADALQHQWRTVKDELPSLLIDIENEFRKLLGTE